MTVKEIFYNFANDNKFEFYSDSYIEKDCCFYNEYNSWAGFAQEGEKDIFYQRVNEIQRRLRENGINYNVLKCDLYNGQWVFKIVYND